MLFYFNALTQKENSVTQNEHTVREMYFISLNKNSFCAGMSIHVMKYTVQYVDMLGL